MDVAIVGGGQAGLSMSWHLSKRGVDHVVLDRGRVADTWRHRRWDHFNLVTPNKHCQLPGFPYCGEDPEGFMGRAEVVEYLEGYAMSFSPPFRGGVEVFLVRPAVGGYQLETSEGRFAARRVVIAAGSYHYMNLPRAAAQLSPKLFQVHSVDYRHPEDLPEGGVLVVGSGQSGTQIAVDLQLAGREVHLSVGGAHRIQRRYRGQDVMHWLDVCGMLDVPIDAHPEGLEVRNRPHQHVTGRDGGGTLDLRGLALGGMHLHGRLRGFDGQVAFFEDDLVAKLDAADRGCYDMLLEIDQRIAALGLEAGPRDVERYEWTPEAPARELDLGAAGITTVVWATGYVRDFTSWVKVPVFDAFQYPRQRRGVTNFPGLYFLGLHWQHTLGSGLLYGVGRDAGHIADHIQDAFAGRLRED